MNRKHPLFLIAGLGALLLVGVTWGLLIYKVGFHPAQHYSFYKIFLQTLRTILVVVLFILVLVVKYFPGKFIPSKAGVRHWSVGFALTLLGVVAVSAFVNPHGRLPWLNYSSIDLATRLIKTIFYSKLEQTPEVIFLGSSRAFTIAPQYLREQAGLSSFNGSVEAGSLADFATMTTMFDARVFVLEVTPPLHSGDEVLTTYAPVQWLPFIPFDLKYSTAEDIFADIFSSQSFSDSIFLFRLRAIGKIPSQWWTFSEDGYGFTPARGLDHNLLETEIANQREISHCTALDEGGVAYLRQIVESAEQKGIAVIVYQSPRHRAFYEQAMRNDEMYQHCHALVVAFMESLQDEYPYFYFRDFTQLETVWTLGDDGFYDSHHLTPRGSEALLDALLPTILEAIPRAHALP